MDKGYCGYCEVLYVDHDASGVHRAGCPNATSGSGFEFLPAKDPARSDDDEPPISDER